MKLFMEVNPQLFDDCSHDYAESQNNADQRQQSRQSRWDKLDELAKARQNGRIEPKPQAPTGQSSKVSSPMRLDESDPLSQDSQRRLEALRLQDDAMSGRERRTKDYDRSSQNSRRHHSAQEEPRTQRSGRQRSNSRPGSAGGVVSPSVSRSNSGVGAPTGPTRTNSGGVTRVG